MISGEEFVANLIKEGANAPCDETSSSFKNNVELPPFYNEEKFKRGQMFFHKNIFSMYFAKFMGLISILAIPTIRNVLVFTKMSNDPLTAYKRYLSTLFHMYVWYEKDFTPGSKLWQSLNEVRCMHNSASKRHCKFENIRISQMDMAITQFGFMGYIVTKPKLVGIHYYDKEDMEAFVHVWRVIGYLMGVEDQFNICRDSIEETKEICNKVLDMKLKPEIEKLEPSFLEMSGHLINGLWCLQPMLQTNVIMSYILSLISSPEDVLITTSLNNNSRIELTKGQTLHLRFVISVISTMRFSVLKWYHNMTQYLTMWLMENFPFLAYYKFGKESCRACKKLFCCENCRNKHEKYVHNLTSNCSICMYGQVFAKDLLKDRNLSPHLETHLPLRCKNCSDIFYSIPEVNCICLAKKFKVNENKVVDELANEKSDCETPPLTYSTFDIFSQKTCSLGDTNSPRAFTGGKKVKIVKFSTPKEIQGPTLFENFLTPNISNCILHENHCSTNSLEYKNDITEIEEFTSNNSGSTRKSKKVIKRRVSFSKQSIINQTVIVEHEEENLNLQETEESASKVQCLWTAAANFVKKYFLNNTEEAKNEFGKRVEPEGGFNDTPNVKKSKLECRPLIKRRYDKATQTDN